MAWSFGVLERDGWTLVSRSERCMALHMKRYKDLVYIDLYNYPLSAVSHAFFVLPLAFAVPFATASFTAFVGFLTSKPLGALRPPKTSPQTATMPEPPIIYAVSLPAHQYNEQKIKGPSALPACPKLL